MNNQDRIAVIGGGISGIVSAYLLSRKYDVTLIESSAKLGGHANTIQIDDLNGILSIDTGFIVFNDQNYPLFLKFLNELGVKYQSSDMSFGVYDAPNHFWYASDIPWGLFAQKRNLLRPKFWKFLDEIQQFNAIVLRDLESNSLDGFTLGAYLHSLPLSIFFKSNYVVPMGAAIWSCSSDDILSFPARSFFSFWKNHRLLTIKKRPKWKTVSGGSRGYIHAFEKQFKGMIWTDSPVRRIKRYSSHVDVVFRDGKTELFDKVIVATHADQAYDLLDTPTQLEESLLSAWHYTHNTVYLHTDSRVMPPSRAAWASWVVQRHDIAQSHLCMTYYMNRLQQLPTSVDYFVTLNDQSLINPEKCIKTIRYTHPAYTINSVSTQSKLPTLNTGNVRFCGSYFGYGFHEDGVKSAVEVAKSLGVEL